MSSGARHLLAGLFRSATTALRPLPDFLILGAQRAGTTTLHAWLAGHPDVREAWTKEIHFFDIHYARGVRWYRGGFPLLPPLLGKGRGGRAITGEATPDYLFHPLVPKRVSRTLPRARFVALLRDPVDRAFSNHQHEVRRGRETRSFEQAVCDEMSLLSQPASGRPWSPFSSAADHVHRSYLSRGLYLDQLARWHAAFPRDRLLVLRSEDLFRYPEAAWLATLSHLGLRRHDLLAPRRHGTSTDRRPEVKTRERLRAFFAPHNARLYSYLGRDLEW